MKKVIALVMAVMMVMSLMTGCGSAPAASTQAPADAGNKAPADRSGKYNTGSLRFHRASPEPPGKRRGSGCERGSG